MVFVYSGALFHFGILDCTSTRPFAPKLSEAGTKSIRFSVTSRWQCRHRAIQLTVLKISWGCFPPSRERGTISCISSPVRPLFRQTRHRVSRCMTSRRTEAMRAFRSALSLAFCAFIGSGLANRSLIGCAPAPDLTPEHASLRGQGSSSDSDSDSHC